MNARTVVLVVAVVSAGLIGGLLFGWMVSVIPGLSRVADRNYIATMQSINVAIVNPAFVAPFLLTPLLLGIASVGQYRSGNHRRAALLGAASVTYVVGVLAVTFGRNIPLNNALDSFDLTTESAERASEQRSSYEGSWNRWHFVRTAASVVAFAAAASAMLVSADPE